MTSCPLIFFIGDDILKLPILGDRARKLDESLPQVRGNVNESLLGPLVAPKLPSRLYFLFQKVPLITLCIDIF